MPNWIHNTITIHGEAALLFIDNGKFDFHQIRPVPKQLDTDDGMRFWCLRNWGTKWAMLLDDQEVTITRDFSGIDAADPSTWHTMPAPTLVIKGRTPWEPPIALLDYIHELQPGLKIDLTAVDSDDTDRTWHQMWR